MHNNLASFSTLAQRGQRLSNACLVRRLLRLLNLPNLPLNLPPAVGAWKGAENPRLAASRLLSNIGRCNLDPCLIGSLLSAFHFPGCVAKIRPIKVKGFAWT
ncbi:hypothetical protein VTK56DRAFT_2387 [Thermocarpiscus australiensis]